MGEPLSDAQVNAALGCDCIADLRAGACGAPLVEAFGCYLRAQHDEALRARECAAGFAALRACMVRHPDEFAELDVARAVAGAAGAVGERK